MMYTPIHNAQENQLTEAEQSHTLTPLNIIRTETVLSKLPIHQLSKTEVVDVHINKKNSNGELALLWKVSPNADFGHPRQLAYRIDKLIIDRKISELGKPLPKIILLQSLRQICRDLGINERRGVKQVKNAMNQNAAAYIQANLSDKGRDGRVRKLSGGFTRYSVFFIGDTLPGDEDKTAESVYIILNDPYWTVLNNAQDRPIDYDYFKMLKDSPSAQRWYEIASYKLFAALEHQHPEARLLYSEYCTFSAQKRRTNHTDFVKHMYIVHKPHLTNRYIQSVRYEKTTDEDGHPDWMMCYIPGERALAQYAAFNTKKVRSGEVPDGKADTNSDTLAKGTTIKGVSEPLELVRLFYKKIHSVDGATAPPKSLKQARDLIEQHGFAKAQFIVTFGCEQAQESGWKPDVFGGIFQYLPQALGHYDKLEKMRHQNEARRRDEQLKSRYERYRDQKIEELKSTISPEELSAMESSIRADLKTEGTRDFLIEMKMRHRRDQQLEGRAGVLPYEEWRAQQIEM
jgi:hypothetical protein